MEIKFDADTLDKLMNCAQDYNCAERLKGLCSRHYCVLPVKCEDCGWAGLVKDCIHTYHGCGVQITMDGQYDEDVEPIDECPACGSENLQ